MKKRIVVKLQIEGIHNWPECPIKEVAFLKHPHRHIFHIVAKKIIAHNDRDVEIIKLKREIIKHLSSMYAANGQTHNLGRMSCEDLAEGLLVKFDLSYCSVLEDNENGSEIEA